MKKILAVIMAITVALCVVGCSDNPKHNDFYDDGIKDQYITSGYIVDGQKMSIRDYAEKLENRYSEMVHVLNVKKNYFELKDGAWKTTFTKDGDKLIFWDWEDENTPAMSGGEYHKEEGGHRYVAKIVGDTLEVKGKRTTEFFKEDNGVTGRIFSNDKNESETYEFHNDGTVDHYKNEKKEKGTFSISDKKVTVSFKSGDKVFEATDNYDEDAFDVMLVVGIHKKGGTTTYDETYSAMGFVE